MSREAGAAVSWRWREREAEVARARSSARRGGVVRALVALAVAIGLAALGRTWLALVPFGMFAVILGLALASPLGAYASLERGLRRFGALVGLLLAYLLLAPVYLFFFVPYGLLTRRGARDPLARRFDRGASTYWAKRGGARSLERPY